VLSGRLSAALGAYRQHQRTGSRRP
jgi:hypothetical protein